MSTEAPKPFTQEELDEMWEEWSWLYDYDRASWEASWQRQNLEHQKRKLN